MLSFKMRINDNLNNFFNQKQSLGLKIQEIFNFCFKISKEYQKLSGLNKKRNVQFATTLFIYQQGHVFALGGGKQRLKGESVLAWFHFSNLLSFVGHIFVIVNFS